MKQSDLIKKNNAKFHINGCQPYCKRKINEVVIALNNSLEHEQCKLEVCYLLRQAGYNIVSEAVRNSDYRRVDVVALDWGSEGQEIEIVHKHADLERYKMEGVLVIYTDRPVKEQLNV